MAFPFLPLGAILAAAVLIGGWTVFGLLLRAIDRTIGGIRESAVPGIVAGLRAWDSHASARAPDEPPPPASPWSLRGADARLIAATPTAASLPAAWPADYPPPEIVDLGSRPIEPRSRLRR